MSILHCGTCEKDFDPDVHVEAEYYPTHKCQDCVFERLEKKHQGWLDYLKPRKQKYGC